MILTYVAGPFSGPTRAHVEQNIARAVALGIEVARIGAWPVIPHANTAHPDFEHVQPYEFWLNATMALLRKCDAVIFTEDWAHSSGARGEQAEAIRLGIPCFYSVDRLRKWVVGGTFELQRAAVFSECEEE